MKKIYSLIFLISIFCSSFAQTGLWTQKANLTGNNRKEATGFSIGTKGYICCGYDAIMGSPRSDVWEYDPSTDAWTQKASVGGGGRSGAVGFSIGTKAYVGIGSTGVIGSQDWWEYDPATIIWTQKNNVGWPYWGSAKTAAVGFSISG